MAKKLHVQAGDSFGFFTVIKESEGHRKPNGATVRMFECLCRCGSVKRVRLTSLTSGTTVSCGCYHKEKSSEILKECATTHGKSKTRMYFVWTQMIQRCHNQKNKSYERYGAVGIKVCEEWRSSFESFAEYMGERPPGKTIDRINTFGNYEPGNVRWASYTEQARNTRRNRLHTIDGVTKCIAEWCEELGEPWTTVKKRLAAGKDPFTRERARRNS